MTTCYRLLFSKTCLKSVLFCLFLLNFFVTFLLTLYHFWLTYPCMIILKYNQTFGVLLFLSSLITLLTFFSYIFLFFLHFIFHYYDKWICTVTPMPIRVGRVFRKRVTYNQIRFWTIHPSPLKSFLHVKVYFLACLCNWPKSPSWCSAVDRSDPHRSQITWSTLVFSVGHVGHSQIFILWKPISTHKLQNGLLSHTRRYFKRLEANLPH